MIRRSHLIGVARDPALEALRCDGHRALKTKTTPKNGPCISGTFCPDYALTEDRPYGRGQVYCTICGTRYGMLTRED